MSGWTPLDLLPGLWLAFLALLLGLGLRRWFDPVPARAWAVWAAVLALLFAPTLLGGRVQLPLGCLAEAPPYTALWRGETPPGNLFQGDLVFQIAPWLERVRAAYSRGEWPLWNDLAGAGEPLLGNPQSQALQPLALLALAFPVAAAAGVLAALRVLLALVFSFLWMRRQGLAEAPALAGSLAFGLGGFLQLWLGWPLAGAAAWLPVLLYALARTDEVGRRRDAALLAVAGAGLLLVGHPESELHAFALAAALAAARLAARPAGRRLPLLRTWALAGAVALGLAAPMLLPAATALPASQRAALIEERHARLAAEGPLAPWRDGERRRRELRDAGRRLLALAAPNAFGNNRFGTYWGPHNLLDDAAGTVGAAALLGALASCLAPRGGRRLRDARGRGQREKDVQDRDRCPRDERLMQGAAAICLIVLAKPPGLPQLLDALPLVRGSLQFHDRIALVLNLAVAYLAACAWGRARRGELRRAPIFATAILLAGLLAWAYLGPGDPVHPGALAGLRRASLAVQLAAVALSAVALAFQDRRQPSPLALSEEALRGEGPVGGVQDLRWLPALVVAGELLFLHLPANPTTPRMFYYPSLPPIALVASRLAPGERLAGLGPAMRPNVASVYGLADARSTNPAKPAAYLAAISRIVPFPKRVADGFVDPRDPLWDLLGIRYVVTGPRHALPPPLTLEMKRGNARVYRRPGALPRLFLPASALPCASPTWSACNAPIRDFAARSAVRDLPSGAPRTGWAADQPAAAGLDLLEVSATHLRARARTALPGPRLLASSVYQEGGWHLLADGQLQTTTLANGPFLAAWLPAGTREIDLLYRPPRFLVAMTFAALALTAGLALWTRPPQERHRLTA